eukprot:CAMPEP_0171781986 /NCGR_PEP_ID=MMETSP0991-20121206/60568_1 /TAXON_ID=483369 /ORGANISM="non described non described, Strain CCMP2098" /LENGTH=95 /DNA_ID=CAMNT_0012389725 /DNA_START=27 /DNA_END=310 /DNA_ORIENTATION=-
MTTPAPTPTPSPTGDVAGPCGLLQEFENECLSELTSSSDFGPICEALVWGVGVEGDRDLAYCSRVLSPTVLRLPHPNFASCAVAHSPTSLLNASA